MMGLGKQAKVINQKQVDALLYYVSKSRNALRNKVIVLLSVRAGLRAKEIASITWPMVVGADGLVGDSLHLTDIASKGRSGRVIPLNTQLRAALIEFHDRQRCRPNFDPAMHLISSERRSHTSPQAVVNLFRRWYLELGLVGCSSHSGRRTFITMAARKISSVGGSLRDVQSLAGHSSLQTTQGYIEANGDAKKRVVNLV